MSRGQADLRGLGVCITLLLWQAKGGSYGPSLPSLPVPAGGSMRVETGSDSSKPQAQHAACRKPQSHAPIRSAPPVPMRPAGPVSRGSCLSRSGLSPGGAAAQGPGESVPQEPRMGPRGPSTLQPAQPQGSDLKLALNISPTPSEVARSSRDCSGRCPFPSHCPTPVGVLSLLTFYITCLCPVLPLRLLLGRSRDAQGWMCDPTDGTVRKPVLQGRQWRPFS